MTSQMDEDLFEMANFSPVHPWFRRAESERCRSMLQKNAGRKLRI
jgi:hypothetical protein